MKINRGERRRVSIVFSVFLLWLVAILFMLFKIQVLGFNKYLKKIRSQSNRIIKLHPKRGTIFDNDKEIMAVSVLSKSMFISNKDKKSSLALFRKIEKVLHIDRNEKRKIIRRIKNDKNFIWIKRKLSDREYGIVKKIDIRNFRSKYDFVNEYKRIYPNGILSGHVLGGVGIDEQGLAGVEFSLDSVIRGKGGKIAARIDARSHIFKFNYIQKRISGKDLYLTIDSTIQYFVQKELRNTIKKFKADSGSVIVMNSVDGSILAMASYPYFDPSRIKYTGPQILKNNAISFLYYPGSTFKVILAASALKRGVCDLDRVINCYNGSYNIKNLKITDDHSYDRLSFKDVIVFSSNIGAAQIGMKIGDSRLYSDVKSFGIGRPLKIHLPAKEKGILNPLDKWDGYSSAYISHGYEVYVTPLQMIRAFNVIASGGYLIEPRILRSIEGMVLKRNSKERVISREIASKIREVMTEVVERGTGKKAAIKGIKVAGKTGTAKKLVKKRFSDVYVSSFGGFFPADDPKITMFVVINEPKGSYYGGDVAAPLFKKIAERIMVVREMDFKSEGYGVITI